MTQMENQSVFALFAGIPFVRRALPIVKKLAAISILLGTITGAVAIVGRVDVADANVIKRPSFHPTFHPATRSLVRAPIRPRSFGTRNVGMHRATAPAYNRNMGHHDVGRHEEGRREGGRREGDRHEEGRHEEGRHDKHTADRHDHQKTGSRNRSQFARIPLPDGPVDVDSFIDSIDDSGPLETVSACTRNPCRYGAMSMANDGAWGGTWNYPNADAARADAAKNCVARTKETCGGLFVAAGTAWIAGLQCLHSEPGNNRHWGVMALGNDLPSAIRNAYRTVARDGFYESSECAFVAAVAADGSQLKYINTNTNTNQGY